MSNFTLSCIERGFCDERGAAFCATATKLPNGEFGMVLLAVKEHALRIYDILNMREIGELLYSVPLREISGLKSKTGVIKMLLPGEVLSFDYNGAHYGFTNMYKVNEQLQVLREEAESGAEDRS